MNNKIIGIFIVTLVISGTLQVVALSGKYTSYKTMDSVPIDVPDSWLEGADQYQTDDYAYGYPYYSSLHTAQEFKPTKEDLTAVALYFFNLNAPTDVKIVVSIKENLTGPDLTQITIDADSKKIEGKGKWILFDFDDIKVIPEKSYYLVCYGLGGSDGKCYCWFFDVNNKYERGLGWASLDAGQSWHDLETDPGGDPFLVQIDLCFITYYQPPPKNKVLPSVLQPLLEKYSNLFPFLNRFF
jgi:hypothetical protein